jgi:hypothetical protein
MERARDARRLAEEHGRHHPYDPGPPPARGAHAGELRQLAHVLERPEPIVDSKLESRHRALEEEIERYRIRAHRLAYVASGAAAAGAMGIVAGLVLRHTSQALVGGAALLGALLMFLDWRRMQTWRVRSLEELRQLAGRIGELRARHDDWAADYDAARARARGLGLEPESARLQEAAAERERWDRGRERLAVWEEAAERLQAESVAASATLRAALAASGVQGDGDAVAIAERHARSCELRAMMRSLRDRVARRAQDEEAMAKIAARRREAEAMLLIAATSCGVEASTFEACRAGLEEWQQARRSALATHEQAQREWTELERLLAGRTLMALQSEAEGLEERARLLAVPFAPHEILDVEGAAIDMDARTAAGRDAELELERLDVELRLRAASAPQVAEAEEAVLEAQRELQRVRGLESTLMTARDFLRRAQDRVHRDIAPQLATTVREALPRITAGRYSDALVDPETLRVQVRDPAGEWRDAALLSHGTAEQVYLLLRMAMARHLVRRGEIVPLVLDDVLVQFDRERKLAVLELLHAASEERQVLLLTQEDDVLDWARRHLQPPRDTILELR